MYKFVFSKSSKSNETILLKRSIKKLVLRFESQKNLSKICLFLVII